MNCPKCGSGTYVVDSRHKPSRIYRRRECRVCGNRFSTAEINEEQVRSLIDKSIAMLRQEMDTAINGIHGQMQDALGVKERVQEDETESET